jgi:multiple sugar transport system substrate-binding protein
LVAAGTTPDMLMLWNGSLSGLNELGIMGDITPLVKKFNVDLTRFETEAIDAVKIASPKGELYGLPYTQQLNALYYNRNLFDKFAVDYPKDGMTWEDAIALAKKVTRTDGGVQYYGLDPENVTRLAFPLSLSPIDTKTGKASVNTDGWRRAFETTYAIYSIPGNERGKFFQFEKEIVAMHAGINMFARLANAAEKGFDNWDVAQYPSLKIRRCRCSMYSPPMKCKP